VGFLSAAMTDADVDGAVTTIIATINECYS
jgi:hypothetical protein